MRRWYRPTLARRILITALLTFVVSLIIITTFSFYQALWNHDNSVDVRRKTFVGLLNQAFSGYETDEQIRTAAEGMQRFFLAQTQHHPSTARLQVWTHNGQRIYTSLDLPAQRPQELASKSVEFRWGGKSYAVTSVELPRYTIDVLYTMPAAAVTEQIMLDILSDILIKMAIAFPLTMLPVWFAIHTGLRPLGALSDALRQRPVDDLTPFASNMRYEELQPVVHAINDLMERLQHKIQQEQTFVHDAAHELQTPLAVIANQTHVLAAATTMEERVEAHRNAEHAIERAGHLVRQMVVLSRLDSDLQTEWKTFDVAANVRELLGPLIPGALARSIELSLDSPDSMFLYGDPAALHSIIGNLVDNSLRYIGEHGRIQIEIESANGVVTLRVLDDGPGIRTEDRERVFDRYYRVAGTGVSGSGLGLAIVKQAVAKMHGTITLTDGLHGRGCAFVVELPVGHSHNVL